MKLSKNGKKKKEKIRKENLYGLHFDDIIRFYISKNWLARSLLRNSNSIKCVVLYILFGIRPVCMHGCKQWAPYNIIISFIVWCFTVPTFSIYLLSHDHLPLYNRSFITNDSNWRASYNLTLTLRKIHVLFS